MLEIAVSSNDMDLTRRKLKFEITYRKNLQHICNKIHAADNLDEILVDLKNRNHRAF